MASLDELEPWIEQVKSYLYIVKKIHTLGSASITNFHKIVRYHILMKTFPCLYVVAQLAKEGKISPS